MTASLKVLLVGATGKVGAHTLNASLDAGHHVKAFGRSIDRIETTHERMELVRGSVLDPDAVSGAMEGVDVVVLTFGAPLNKDTLLHVPDLCRRGTEVVLDAMGRHGVPRLVCMTAIGAGDSEGHGRFVFRNFIEPVLLGRIMKDRTAQEELVRASSLPQWVIVRPTELTDGPSAPVRVVRDLEREPEPTTIARADVGRFLAGCITDHSHDGSAVVLTN